MDYCKPAIVHVCVELGNVHGSISAAPLDPAFYVKVDSYKKSTPTGPVNLSCVVIKAGIDGPNTWLNECSLVLGTLGFWYDHTVIPWTGAERSVSKTDPLDDPAERTPIVELCSAEVGAWVAGTGTSETVKNVPCGLA